MGRYSNPLGRRNPDGANAKDRRGNLSFCESLSTTGGRDRTDTFLRILDFESSASANSATPASLMLRYLRSGRALRLHLVLL
jgi:hypothetical protein